MSAVWGHAVSQPRDNAGPDVKYSSAIVKPLKFEFPPVEVGDYTKSAGTNILKIGTF